MKTIEITAEQIEMSISDVRLYLKSENKTMANFYFNVYGWNSYYTLERTFATPTGKLYKEGFPSVVKITIYGSVKPIKETDNIKIG